MLRIFDIQRFSVQDGPGIRTSVFLKGCNVGCLWCQNPESLSREPQLMYYEEKCVLCGACTAVCAQGVHELNKREHRLNRSACIACGACAKVCPAGALELAGYDIGTAELMESVLRDKAFYEKTGGGVTFSGGEPLAQAAELAKVLQRCKAKDIHTAVETSSNVPEQAIRAVMPYTDLLICDIKCASNALHKKVTRTGNGAIQRNLEMLFHSGKNMWIRIPVIPGVNDTEQELMAMAALIRRGGAAVERIEFMPYHDFGKSKYTALGMDYPFETKYGKCENAKQRVRFAQKVFSKLGLNSLLMRDE